MVSALEREGTRHDVNEEGNEALGGDHIALSLGRGCRKWSGSARGGRVRQVE